MHVCATPPSCGLSGVVESFLLVVVAVVVGSAWSSQGDSSDEEFKAESESSVLPRTRVLMRTQSAWRGLRCDN